MSQLSFSDAEGHAKQKQTRHEKFLTQMDDLLPSVFFKIVNGVPSVMVKYQYLNFLNCTSYIKF